MLAVFATLAFLIAMWLCATIVAAAIEHRGSSIRAALRGRSVLTSPSVQPIKVRVSQRYPSVSQRPMRARAGLRAAA